MDALSGQVKSVLSLHVPNSSLDNYTSIAYIASANIYTPLAYIALALIEQIVIEQAKTTQTGPT